MQIYTEGKLRSDNYERAARIIIDAVADTSPISYVTYGNPLVFDSVAQNLLAYSKKAGIKVQVVAGLSSVDTMFCDLEIDMAPGVQILDATWMVACRIQPEVSLGLVLLQIGAFGSLRTHYRSLPSPSSLANLASHLAQYYPATHEIFLIRSADGKSTNNAVPYALGDICCAKTADILNASMYIPALREPTLDELRLAEMLQT
jgi:uncharacterized protein YabN with tetrapyrrole methylase and pyrophosphatase domain